MRGISTSGDLVVRLYDGPLMGINHARSAHAALNEARLRSRRRHRGGDQACGRQIEKLMTGIAEDLKIVRERVNTKDVTPAMERAEMAVAIGPRPGPKILKPHTGGVTSVPLLATVARKGERRPRRWMILWKWSRPTALTTGWRRRIRCDGAYDDAGVCDRNRADRTDPRGRLFLFMSKPIFVAMEIAGGSHRVISPTGSRLGGTTNWAVS